MLEVQTRDRIDRILCNELVESKPISNLEAREKVEELYKRIHYNIFLQD